MGWCQAGRKRVVNLIGAFLTCACRRYTAVVTAGAGNVIFTRWPEVSEGVPIRDLDGRTLGLSNAAAMESIKLTVISRNVFLPMTPMLLPPLIMGGLRKMPIVAAGQVH